MIVPSQRAVKVYKCIVRRGFLSPALELVVVVVVVLNLLCHHVIGVLCATL